MSEKIIVWFRQDLRINDNPALKAALNKGDVYPIYILDDVHAGEWKMGEASRLWLHHALDDLNTSLDGKLALYHGDPLAIIPRLCAQIGARQIFWNRCYEPWRTSRDSRLKEQLAQQNIVAKSYNGSLLWEPWEVMKKDATPYKVFTPYYKKGCLSAHPPAPAAGPLGAAHFLRIEDSLSLTDLSLLTALPWGQIIVDHWDISEQGAHERFHAFLENGLERYKRGRDFPMIKGVSRLSPYLHFGQISVHQIWQKINDLPLDENQQHFMSELGWREFSHYLLFHFPTLPRKNFQPKFDAFPWQENPSYLSAWQQGITGIPMVDAGMRQLWQTGYMHNRVRMICASFLTKNLQIDWRMGEDWFWDCLVDADLAANSASWQWVAGSGEDAAPYFRIFNPVTQGQKFDPDGDYIRHYIPELSALDKKYIHAPWMAPKSILNHAGITLGKEYPLPIIDLKNSRTEALRAYNVVKSANAPAKVEYLN